MDYSHFERLFNHSLACSALPLGYEGCQKFWGVVYLLGLVLLFVVCIMAIIYNESAAFKAYQKHLHDGAMDADDYMQSAKWEIDDNYDEFSETELAQSFRQSFNQFK